MSTPPVLPTAATPVISFSSGNEKNGGVSEIALDNEELRTVDLLPPPVPHESSREESPLGSLESGEEASPSSTEELDQQREDGLVSTLPFFSSKKRRMIAGAGVMALLVVCLVVIGLFITGITRPSHSPKEVSPSNTPPHSLEVNQGTPSKKTAEMGLAKMPDVTEKPPGEEEVNVVESEPETVQTAASEREINEALAEGLEETSDSEGGSAAETQADADRTGNRPSNVPPRNFKRKRKEQASAETWATNPFKKQ
jgi:hypothetical protein